MSLKHQDFEDRHTGLVLLLEAQKVNLFTSVKITPYFEDNNILEGG